MKKTIRLSESELHRVIKESVRKILKEDSEPYKWEGLDDDRKEFEKHLSWRNKEEVDANDKAITNPLSYMNKQDSDRIGQMIQANRTSKPGAKMSWDWGYKSGRGVDDPTDVKTISDFEKAEDEFVNPYDSKHWHDYALRDEFWDGIPESRTLNTKKTIRLSESDLHRVISETVKRVLKETYNPFDDDGFEDWERRNVSPVSDDEYDEIMRMNPMENSSYIFNKIGFNKWNGFVSRWSKENPEEYERFMQSQMAF